MGCFHEQASRTVVGSCVPGKCEERNLNFNSTRRPAFGQGCERFVQKRCVLGYWGWLWSAVACFTSQGWKFRTLRMRNRLELTWNLAFSCWVLRLTKRFVGFRNEQVSRTVVGCCVPGISDGVFLLVGVAHRSR